MIKEDSWPVLAISYCTITGHSPFRPGENCPDCERMSRMQVWPEEIEPEIREINDNE